MMGQASVDIVTVSRFLVHSKIQKTVATYVSFYVSKNNLKY